MEHTLLRTRLSETSSIKDWTLAATKLQQASNFELSPGVSILQVSSPSSHSYIPLCDVYLGSQAVTERNEYFSSLSFKFGRGLQEHLTGLFVQQVYTMVGMVETVIVASANFVDGLLSHEIL